MKALSYSIVEKLFTDEVLGKVKVYGILSSDGRRIDGITSDYAKLKGFVDEMNETGIPPCHFRDVVEDFICEQATVALIKNIK